MGKNKRNQSVTSRSDDDISDVSSDPLLRLLKQNQSLIQKPLLHIPPPTFDLKPLEDRRTWHPDGRSQQAPQATQKAHRRLLVSPATTPAATSQKRAQLPSRLEFSAPKHVVLCVRRKQRKEVLFAKGKTGKGARSRRRHNSWSSVKC